MGWPCYKFALKVGISSIFKKNYKIGLKQFLFPISYWRFPVFEITNHFIGDSTQKKVLDIGSPKLLSLYLALKRKHTVYATDLQDRDIFNRYQKHFEDYIFSQKSGKYIVEFQDTRALSYPENYFDYIYSISVIEHIPDQGDTKAMEEIERVLKPNGTAIIEVPFSLNAKEEYMNQSVYDRTYENEPVFYQRHYDKETLFSRLINPSKLCLEKIILTAEKYPFEKYWNQIPSFAKIPFLWVEPFISYVNHFHSNIDMEILNKLLKKSGMNATIILKKTKV